MSKLLDQAIQEAQKLSESEQDAIGAWLLAELESDSHWDVLFSTPSAAIDRMAQEALDEYRAGRTTALDSDKL